MADDGRIGPSDKERSECGPVDVIGVAPVPIRQKDIGLEPRDYHPGCVVITTRIADQEEALRVGAS